jgi:hypothetical protein
MQPLVVVSVLAPESEAPRDHCLYDFFAWPTGGLFSIVPFADRETMERREVPGQHIVRFKECSITQIHHTTVDDLFQVIFLS